MLKLYYAPSTCSLSPHIALRESGVPFELVLVDFAKGRATADGKTLEAVNPKNQVPALALDDGGVLTEGAAMVQYIADLAPGKALAPAAGTFARVRLQEWLNFIATELHKGVGPLYSPIASDEYKKATRERVRGKLDYVAKTLAGPYLMGAGFSVADGYLLYALRTWRRLDGELPTVLADYAGRVTARPAVRAALDAEGLTP
jgi:glutathione S-transferase